MYKKKEIKMLIYTFACLMVFGVLTVGRYLKTYDKKTIFKL